MLGAITIDRVSKTYGGKGAFRRSGGSVSKEALKSISLTIEQGSFFGLLGPNGAGKSTLINIIAGLVIKSAGQITVNGIDLDEDPRGVRRVIGVVPQEVVLDPFFSVRETLEFHAGYYGIPKSRRRTSEIMEALHLTDKANMNSRRLSGGMKRRVLIAKALVHAPPILILDEPTAGVDVELRQQLWDYVRGLNRQGATILLTTHYLEEAETLCDRIAIINHGEIIACDRTEALVRRLDQKQLIIRFREPLKQMPPLLASFQSDLLLLELTKEGYLAAKYSVGMFQAQDLFDVLRKIGLVIRDISTEEATLEDIFKQLVYKAA